MYTGTWRIGCTRNKQKTPANAVNLNTTNLIDEINADIDELVIYKQKLDSNGNADDSFEKLEHIKRHIEKSKTPILKINNSISAYTIILQLT